MKKHLLALVCILFSFQIYNSQDLVNIDIQMTSVSHNHQCCDDAAGSCGGFPTFINDSPEPRWRFTSSTSFQGAAGPWNTTWLVNPGTDNCGTINITSGGLDSYSGICADQVNFWIDMWEEDGCGSDDTFDDNCTFNDDESRTLTFPSEPLALGTTSYTYSGTGGYSITIEVTASVVSTPNLNLASNTNVCTGSNAFLDATSTQTVTGGNFFWYDSPAGGNLVFTGNPFNPIVNTSTSYFVAYGNGTCETSRLQVNVTELALPNAGTATNTTICDLTSIDLSTTIIGNDLGGTWNDDSSTGSLTGSVFDATGLGGGAYDFTYSVSGGACPPDDETVTINVETLSSDPFGSFASNNSVCSGDLVNLTVAGGSLGTSASWNWYTGSCGGTLIGTGSTTVVNPTVSTDYYVRAEGNCGTTNCDTVSVSVVPTAITIDSALADNYLVCPEDPVQLTAYYSSPLPSNYIITWYTGACGAVPIGVGDNITVTPTDTTIYYVQCVGTCGVSVCDTVQVNVLGGSTSPGSVTATNNNFCTGGTTTLTVNGGTLTSGAQWTWYSGSCASTVIGTGSSINVTPTASTMYYVSATGGTCGATSCASIFINVFALNVFQVPFDTLCSNDSTSFTLTGGNPSGGTYSGTGVVNDVFDPTLAGLGTHSITYSYTDPNGCNGSVVEDIVIQESNFKPDTISYSTTEICDGSYAVLWLDSLYNDLAPGTMWVWYEGECGGGTPIDTTYNLNTYLFDNTGAPILDPITGEHIYVHDTIIVSPSSTTNYYVRTEGGECGPTECIGITVSVYTLETNLLSYENVCGSATPPFNLTGGIPSGGTYSGTGVTNNVFDPSVAGIGVHDITYTYSSAGCTITDTEPINVISSPINVYHTIEQESCSEGGVLIHLHTTDGAGFYSYLWSDGSIEAPLMYAQPGDYTVLVSDANDCSTLYGPINISDSLGCIEMPNSFTPNGDGINDTWNLDFSMYGGGELTIFSKWGNIVYQENLPTFQWDGNYNNMPLPAGTYYYIIKLNNGLDQNGPVTIVR